MQNRRFIVLATIMVVCLLSNGPSTAQQADNPKTQMASGLDITNRYFWRGLMLSPGVSVQPFMKLSQNDFTAGVWGSSTLHTFEWQEVDLYVSYEWKYLRFSVFDYFYFNDTLATPRFFDYRKDKTGHVLEFITEFTGTDDIPFRLLTGYNFYGADKEKTVYMEMAWMKNFGNIDFELFCGFTPHKGYYHKTKNGFTNVGAGMTRNIEINEKISLPLKITFAYNPLNSKAFIIASLGIY